jgi:Putative Ig domain
MKRQTAIAGLVAATLLIICAACGGGGSSSPSNGGTPAAETLTIATASVLPGTLQGHEYSATLAATGGQGALHWSMAPAGATTLFPTGLVLDAATGTISGTVNFLGTAGFLATVTDSSSQTASKSFTITANTPLALPQTQAVTSGLYQDLSVVVIPAGGVAPFTYTLDGSCLPPGVRSNAGNVSAGTSGVLTLGQPYVAGIYSCQVTIQDSFTPPETASQVVRIYIVPDPLSIQTRSLPSNLLLNRPFSGSVIVRGGIPPYSYALVTGAVPAGLGPLQTTTGQISGTPTATGLYTFGIRVTDSESSNATSSFSINVVAPKGRNDTPATATPIRNGSFSASISPYDDPPDGTPAPGDNDYYKLVSLGGATVHVETNAKRPLPTNTLDTVIEIVDGNGQQLSACRQPGDTGTSFNSDCINDDIGGSPYVQDSALDYHVPGPTNIPSTFYVRVLDWRGDARPDMTYTLNVSGLAAPLTISTAYLAPAARGILYSQNLSSANGAGGVTWSIDSGALPPDLSLGGGGLVGGTPTTNGTYSFTVRATDSANPPQTTTRDFTIEVVDLLAISSPAVWPDACLNQPYSFAAQTSGGAPPVIWGFQSLGWVRINMQDNTGVFSGTPDMTGTFTGKLNATDATGNTAWQDVTLTIKTCP